MKSGSVCGARSTRIARRISRATWCAIGVLMIAASRVLTDEDA
ncbi:hypothetical protein OKW39_009105 [Paraburkholderia sp. MM6662-R1]